MKMIKALAQNRVLKNFMVYLTSGTIARAMPFIVLPIIANVLTPADFGLISNFQVLVQFCFPFISLRLVRSLEADYYKTDEAERKATISNLIYLMSGLAAVLLILFSIFPRLVLELLRLEYQWIVIAVIVAWGNNLFQIRTSLLRLQENSRLFGIFQVLNAVLSASLTLLFILILKWSWEGRVMAALITSGLMVLLTLAFFVRHGWIPRPFERQRIRGFLIFGLPLLPHALAPFLRNAVDRVIITHKVSLAANGIFSLMAALSSVFEMMVSAFFSAYVPFVYKKLSIDEKLAEHTARQLVVQGYWFFAILAAILFVGYFGLRIGILWFLKPDYHAGIAYLPWFLLDVHLKAAFQLFANYIIYSKKTTPLGALAFSTGLLQMLLSILMVPRVGVVGALYAMIIADFVRLGFAIVLAQRYCWLPWLSTRKN